MGTKKTAKKTTKKTLKDSKVAAKKASRVRGGLAAKGYKPGELTLKRGTGDM